MLDNISVYDEVMLDVPQYELLTAQIVQHIDALPASCNVLELGCGSGLLTAALLKSSNIHRVTAVEPDGDACETLRQKISSLKLHLINTPFEDFVPEERYDVIASRFVIHHIPDEGKLACLEKMAALLKPGGTLLVGDMVIPDFNSEEERLEVLRVYYDTTIVYFRNLNRPSAIEDQVMCYHQDVTRTGEYKISEPQMLRLCAQAGLKVEALVPIDGTDTGYGMSLPGIILLVLKRA